MALLGPVRYWKEQSQEKWAHLTHPPKIHGRKTTGGHFVPPPPCKIGLMCYTILHSAAACIDSENPLFEYLGVFSTIYIVLRYWKSKAVDFIAKLSI